MRLLSHATKLLSDNPYCYRISSSLIDGLVPWRKRLIAIILLHGCTCIIWQASTLALEDAFKLQRVYWSIDRVRTRISATWLPVNATAIQANLSSAARVFGHKSGHHQRVIALSRSWPSNPTFGCGLVSPAPRPYLGGWLSYAH
jgi:hypothetical protein